MTEPGAAATHARSSRAAPATMPRHAEAEQAQDVINAEKPPESGSNSALITRCGRALLAGWTLRA
jgi:hypothetical protein